MNNSFVVLRGGLVWAGLGLSISVFASGCGGVVRVHDDGDSGPGSGGSGASTPGTGAVSSGATSSGGGSSGKGGGAGVVGTGGGKAGGAGSGGTVGKGGAGGVIGAGGGKAGSSGGAGKGGGAGAGGTIGKGGAGGVVQGGVAGVPIGGSAGACAGVSCPTGIKCPVGSMPYVPAGACCAICGPNCNAVDCADRPCPPGSMAVRLPGQCCATSCTPVYVPDAGPICDQQGYVTLRKQLESKYDMLSCSADSDCSVVVTTQCGVADCGAAIPSQLVMSYISSLQSFAASNCINCPPSSGCSTSLSAMCLNGFCQLIYPVLGR